MASVTCEPYQAGDVIFTEEPFVRVLRQDMWDRVCAGCLDRDTSYKKCGSCGIMKYCGKSCQKKAWRDHKLECPLLRNYTNRREQPLVQMIGNIILKLKGRNWEDVTVRIMDDEVSFADLSSHADDNLNMLVECMSIVNPLTSYIGKENMPNETTLFELFGKVVNNRFGFSWKETSSEDPGGWSLFFGLSKLSYSCVPNALSRNNGASLTVRAIKTFQKSEKVTIRHCVMLMPMNASCYDAIPVPLKRSFTDNCYCVDCSQQFGTSDLTKILDMSKAPKVLQETDRTFQLLSLLMDSNYDINGNFVSRAKLKQLLQKQEGVLGKTNLRRMRTLTMLLCLEGPDEERRKALVELTDAMKEVWGENNPELLPIYQELLELKMKTYNIQEAKTYINKIFCLEAVCFGKNINDELDEIEMKFAIFLARGSLRHKRSFWAPSEVSTKFW